VELEQVGPPRRATCISCPTNQVWCHGRTDHIVIVAWSWQAW